MSKKHTYRAEKIKDVNRHQLVELVAGRKVVVGIDVAKEKMFAAIGDSNAQILKIVKWQHPVETPRFVELLEGLDAELEAAMEPTGTYGDTLRCHLNAAEIDVYRVSAKRVSDAKEVYDGVPSSHDAKAASIIVKLHVDKASELWVEDRDELRDLRASIRVMSTFDGQLQRGINTFEALLARHWPEVTKLLELDSATLLSLLETYGCPARIAERRAEAERVMKKASRGTLKPEKRDAVLRSASETVGVAMTEYEVEQIKILAADTLRAKRQALKAKSKVEALSDAVSTTKAMGEAVGKVTAAVLVCMIGDPHKFSSASAYAKSAGLNLKIRSSGKHRGTLKITKRGSGLARRYLYLAVLRLIRLDPVVNAWYVRKVSRDGGHEKKVGKIALVAIMRKLIRALWYVARGDQFDSRKLYNVQRLNMAI